MSNNKKDVKVSSYFETLYKMGIKRDLSINKELIKNILNEDYKEFNVSLLCKEDRFSIYSRFRAMFRAYRPLKKQCTNSTEVIGLYNYFYQSLKKLISKIKSNKLMHKITISSGIFYNLEAYDEQDISKIFKECGFRWRNRAWHVENIMGIQISNNTTILKLLHYIYFKTNLIEAEIANNFMQFEIKKPHPVVPVLDWNLLQDSSVMFYPDFETEINFPLLKASIQYDMRRTKEIIPHHDKLSLDIIIDKSDQGISWSKNHSRSSQLLNLHVFKKYLANIRSIAETVSFERLSCLNEFTEFLNSFFCNPSYSFHVDEAYYTSMISYTYQNILSSSKSENNIYIQEKINPSLIYKIKEFQTDPDVLQKELDALNTMDANSLKQHIDDVLTNCITIKCNLCTQFKVSALKTDLNELRMKQFHHFQTHYASSLIRWLCSECVKPIFERDSKHDCKNAHIRLLLAGGPEKNVNNNSMDTSSNGADFVVKID